MGVCVGWRVLAWACACAGVRAGGRACVWASGRERVRARGTVGVRAFGRVHTWACASRVGVCVGGRVSVLDVCAGGHVLVWRVLAWACARVDLRACERVCAWVRQ